MTSVKITLNDFHRQWMETAEDVLSATAQVGASGWYILGRQVQVFEECLATWAKLPYVVGCANGLDAIEIALRASGLQPGGKVLTTPLSAFATTLAIVRAGGVPVFVDTDAGGLIDLQAARLALSGDRSIRHVVPVHLFGHSCDLDVLRSVRDDLDVVVVEDMAQAIGASWGDAPVGSVGQMSATSFYPTKNLGALGDGGAVLSSDAGLAAKCRVLRDYGQSAKYMHAEMGLNSRLDELQAAIMSKAHLPRLSGWTAARQRVAQRYLEGLDNPLVRPVPTSVVSKSVWHLFPVTVDPHVREAFMGYMGGRGVATGVHYPIIIPDQGAMQHASHSVLGDLAQARRLARMEVSLPIHPYLTDEEVARVIAAVNDWGGA